MVILYIVLGLLGLALLLLFLPLTLVLDYKEEFSAELRFLCFRMGLSDDDKHKKSPKAETKSEKKNKENPIKRLFKEKEIGQAVGQITAFVRRVLGRLKKVASHIAVRDVRLDMRIATPDAAHTAVEYGAVCSALYPFFSFLSGVMDVKLKKLDIIADFAAQKSTVSFHAAFRAGLLFLVAAIIGVYKEYIILTEDKKDERK